jgi:hypothetical protein
MDTNTSYFNLIKPEIGGSLDTWGEKLNTNMDSIDAALEASARLNGSKPFTAKQTFADAGIQIGDFVIAIAGGNLKITNGGDACITLTAAGVLTAKNVVANPALT